MLMVAIGTVVYALLRAVDKVEQVEHDKAWRECEETDWNEYYSNMNSK